jgi:bifunctional UDP-N-acetylglucosamine pyrophosphorylase/glucosamine-1-phosphate N-acetyltransferase
MKYFSIFNIFKKIKTKTFINNSYIQELISKDVIIKDINSTYIDRSVKIGSGTVVMPSTFILGDTKIGSNCLLGPNSTISNSQISDEVEIVYSIVLDSYIGKNSKIGPFTFIREESRIGEKVEIGNFVEIKSSEIAENTKSKHLAYLGDVSIDKNVNIGAGFVSANFDGKNKQKSKIKENVFIGSNSTIVSPVIIHKNSIVGAGSVVINDVPESSTAIGVPAKSKKKE